MRRSGRGEGWGEPLLGLWAGRWDLGGRGEELQRAKRRDLQAKGRGVEQVSGGGAGQGMRRGRRGRQARGPGAKAELGVRWGSMGDHSLRLLCMGGGSGGKEEKLIILT